MKVMRTVKDHQHGTYTGYVYGCRCHLCKQACVLKERGAKAKAYHREYWQRPDVKQAHAESMRKPSSRKLQNDYLRDRRKRDHAFGVLLRLRSRLNNAISYSCAQKNFSTSDLAGCDLTDLVRHIESQFTDGMTWENRHLWHIDHIRPCASFDLTDPQQQKACFHYTNLQPLWAKDNMSKGDSWNEERGFNCESSNKNSLAAGVAVMC